MRLRFVMLLTRTASRTLRNPLAFISVHQRSLAAYERLIKGSEIGRADAGAPVRYAVHWLIVFYLQMNMADAHAVCDALTRTASRTLRNPLAFISGPWLLISGLDLSHAPLCLRDTKPPR